jgi:hypothetical protein
MSTIYQHQQKKQMRRANQFARSSSGKYTKKTSGATHREPRRTEKTMNKKMHYL